MTLQLCAARGPLQCAQSSSLGVSVCGVNVFPNCTEIRVVWTPIEHAKMKFNNKKKMQTLFQEQRKRGSPNQKRVLTKTFSHNREVLFLGVEKRAKTKKVAVFAK